MGSMTKLDGTVWLHSGRFYRGEGGRGRDRRVITLSSVPLGILVSLLSWGRSEKVMWKKGRLKFGEQWDSIVLSQTESLPVPETLTLWKFLHAPYLDPGENISLRERKHYKEIWQINVWLKPNPCERRVRMLWVFRKTFFCSSFSICKVRLCLPTVFLNSFLPSHFYSLAIPTPSTF